MKLRTTGEYPCQWDDIIDEQRETHVTVYTLEEARKKGVTKTGIIKGRDGIFDIVIDVSELTKKVINCALKELSKTTGIEYKLSNKIE